MMKDRTLIWLFMTLAGLLLASVAAAVWLYLDGGRVRPDELRSMDASTSGLPGDPFASQTAQDQIDSAHRAVSETGIITLGIDRFQLRMSRYPQDISELVRQPEALGEGEHWDGPYVNNLNLLNDPWGRPYRYACPGTHNPARFDLWSCGADGVSDNIDDIGNW